MIPSNLATKSAEEIKKKRRLLYVAMTQAKDVLAVYFPLRYYRRGRELNDAHSYAQLTQFIPTEVRSLFDQRSGSLNEASEEVGDVTVTTDSREDVDGYLARLWSE